MDLFTDVIESITDAYAKLGHTLGWSFLYTPARTLTSNAPLLFLGLNPGGSECDEARSSEEGNAYRVKPWGAGGRLNPLQDQVSKLYELIAPRLGTVDPNTLMDSAISANFCPFRSRSWNVMPKQAESVKFSKSLWTRILQVVTPPAIVCLGKLPAYYIRSVLHDLGWKGEEPLTTPVGWGNSTYSVSHLRYGDRETLVVRLPHLSRYRIVGKAECESAVTQIVAALANSIRLRQAP